MVNFSHDRVDVMVLGRKVLMSELQRFVMDHYRAVLYRDVLKIELTGGEAWIFDYGPLVLWGVIKQDKDALLSQLSEYIDSPATKPEFESFQFELSARETRIHRDKLSLISDEELLRLAASHGFAQSVKLNVFEAVAQEVIQNNEYIPRALARNGKIPLRRRQLAKLRGALFSTRSDILLNFNLLDTPEIFWDYTELEPIYMAVAKYLDIVPRINILSKKLETIHELLDMLAGEQNHQHSAFLEWIIIVLIAVDIVLYFGH